MKKIFVAGHSGMVGSALCRQLQKQADVEIIKRTREELNLCDQSAVHDFMKKQKPDEVILAAAKVGGIHANNTYPAEFIYENLQIQNNVIHASHVNNVQKLLFLGSSCIYPREAEQPMKEDALLTGVLEPTNEPYAIAKIAGIKMCESYNRQYGRDYRCVMPTNLYGPGDNYHPENSHVLPALIHKLHLAKINGDKEVLLWGTGSPLREFMYVDDLARSVSLIMKLTMSQFHDQGTFWNIGTGTEISIKQVASLVARVVGFSGNITFDVSKPNGAPRKLMNSNKLSGIGFKPRYTLIQGIEKTYEHYLMEL